MAIGPETNFTSVDEPSVGPSPDRVSVTSSESRTAQRILDEAKLAATQAELNDYRGGQSKNRQHETDTLSNVETPIEVQNGEYERKEIRHESFRNSLAPFADETGKPNERNRTEMLNAEMREGWLATLTERARAIDVQAALDSTNDVMDKIVFLAEFAKSFPKEDLSELRTGITKEAIVNKVHSYYRLERSWQATNYAFLRYRLLIIDRGLADEVDQEFGRDSERYREIATREIAAQLTQQGGKGLRGDGITLRLYEACRAMWGTAFADRGQPSPRQALEAAWTRTADRLDTTPYPVIAEFSALRRADASLPQVNVSADVWLRAAQAIGASQTDRVHGASALLRFSRELASVDIAE